MTCENCLMFTHCRYDLARNGKPCEHFKNKTDKLRENIISDLTYSKDCWEALAAEDSLYLLGRIDAIKMAICVINAEFDKAKNGVDGK